MQDIVMERETVNIEMLDIEIRVALGQDLVGVSAGNGQVIVHLNDGVTAAQIDQARQLVAAHDPTVLSPAQEAQRELMQMRQANAVSLDAGAYAGESDLIHALAEKIVWLEREIRDLRRV